MRKGATTFGAVLTAVALAPLAAGARQPPLSQLRVCGHDRVPFAGTSCPRDQRSSPLAAGELDCSVRVSVARPTTILAQFLYQGAIQYSYTDLVRRSGQRLIGVYMHNTKMPAGSYGCRFTLGGQRVAASFRSAGPAGRVLGAAACLGAHAVNTDECPKDESGAPLPSTSSVTCAAVFARERGQTATIELLRGGAVVQSARVSLDYPITEAGTTFRGAGAFAAGAYDCRFTVPGAQADRAFTISG